MSLGPRKCRSIAASSRTFTCQLCACVSHRGIVPMNHSNKDGPSSAESEEGGCGSRRTLFHLTRLRKEPCEHSRDRQDRVGQVIPRKTTPDAVAGLESLHCHCHEGCRLRSRYRVAGRPVSGNQPAHETGQEPWDNEPPPTITWCLIYKCLHEKVVAAAD